MIDIQVPDFVWAGLLLTGVLLFGALQEFKAKNLRDARLLAAIGTLGLAGAGVTCYF